MRVSASEPKSPSSYKVTSYILFSVSSDIAVYNKKYIFLVFDSVSGTELLNSLEIPGERGKAVSRYVNEVTFELYLWKLGVRGPNLVIRGVNLEAHLPTSGKGRRTGG